MGLELRFQGGGGGGWGSRRWGEEWEGRVGDCHRASVPGWLAEQFSREP